jgi:hypothetical protein
MYFNFFDRARSCGGFVRIGNRANEGYAEVTLCLYLPGGDVLFSYQRPRITSNDAFDAGGMRFEVVEPLARLRSLYEGSAVHLKDPTQLSDPGRALRENPKKTVTLDLVHEAAGPVYGSTGSGHQIMDPETEFARAHYEQHTATRGTMTVEGEPLEIDGLGLRDHSWGPRYWQALKYYRWLTCNFGPQLAFMATEIVHHDGKRRESGVVVRGGRLTHVKTVDIQTTFAPNNLYHRALVATLGLEDGDALRVEGRVKAFVPLRNRRAGAVTHIGEGMTEYRSQHCVGLGIAEYLDQLRQ